jgi:DNA-binding MarR family transcriptional regulator
MDAEHVVFEAMRRIVRSLDVHSRALLRDHKLTGPQLSVLKELARLERAPIGTLAKNTFLGAPTVTGVVDRLARQGWVVRGPGSEDRRQVMITITDEGRRLLESDRPLFHRDFCLHLRQLPEVEQQQICDVLQRVAKMMEASALEVAG